jgi:hypothetical protein
MTLVASYLSQVDNSSYFKLLSRFSISTEEPDELKKAARLTANHFITVLTQLEQIDYFSSVSEEVTWLFSTEEIEDLISRI